MIEEKVVKDDMIPKQAIIVYSGNGKHYLETRRILKSGKFAEGIPLEKKTLAKIIKTIDTKELNRVQSSGLLPENLLLFKEVAFELNLIWYVKASKHHLVFSENLGIDDGVMDLPTLVFKLRGNSLNVYAIKTNNPAENTKLYRAPFHNVNTGGAICMGSSYVRDSNEVGEIMKNYEDGFFMSKFNAIHGGAPIKGNLNTFIQKQIKGKLPFDNNVLTPNGIKIGDLI
jgi:PRTRC genetic system protein B